MYKSLLWVPAKVLLEHGYTEARLRKSTHWTECVTPHWAPPPFQIFLKGGFCRWACTFQVSCCWEKWIRQVGQNWIIQQEMWFDWCAPIFALCALLSSKCLVYIAILSTSPCSMDVKGQPIALQSSCIRCQKKCDSIPKMAFFFQILPLLCMLYTIW